MKVLSKLNSLDNVNDGDTRKLITKTSESGAGNVVSSISVSGDTISYTKGVNALTSHQNAFSNVKVGSSTVAADQAEDTLELVAGSNITLTPDTTNDKVTIAATVPTKTSDLTNDSGFITSDSDEKVKQTANTSSNSALRVLFAPNVLDTDYTGNVNKNSNFTYNPSTKALATGGTVDGYKLAAASAKGVDTSIAAASTSTNLPTSQAVAGFVEGKGYTTNTGTITGVSVNGTSVATSGVANITSVPASILSGAITNGVTATTQSANDNSTKIATTAYADNAVSGRLEKSHTATNIVGSTLWSGNSLVSTVINTQTINGNGISLSDTEVFLGDNTKGKLKISNGTNNDSIELGRTYNNNWYGLEVDSSGVSITGLKTPTNDTDAVNKQYVDNNHSIKDITNGNVYIGNLESGYYNVFAGVTLYASEETVELILSVGRKAFMCVSHELSDGEDTVSYWILNDETDIEVDASESTAVLNNWGQILYQGVFVDSTGDSWRGSFSLKQADYVTAYDVVDNLTTNNSYKVLSARQGYLLNQNKQNTILSGTTNPTSDLGVNGDIYIKYIG